MDVIVIIFIGLISFGFLIATHELGHLISALILKIKVSEYSIGFGPTLFETKKNGVIYKLSLLPIGGYVNMPEKKEKEEPSLISPDVPVSSDGVPFSQASMPAKLITLLAGSLTNILTGYLIILFVFIFVENGSFNLNPTKIFDNFLMANGFFKDVIVILVDSFEGLLNGTYGLKDLTGPIGVTKIIGESFNTSFYTYLIFMAFIAINVGVFNLFPIPALDGGRALFCIIESIFKKQFTIKIQESLHTVGLFLLLGLIAVITLKDILNLITIF